jgi:hypothetical protein
LDLHVDLEELGRQVTAFVHSVSIVHDGWYSLSPPLPISLASLRDLNKQPKVYPIHFSLPDCLEICTSIPKEAGCWGGDCPDPVPTIRQLAFSPTQSMVQAVRYSN